MKTDNHTHRISLDFLSLSLLLASAPYIIIIASSFVHTMLINS